MNLIDKISKKLDENIIQESENIYDSPLSYSKYMYKNIGIERKDMPQLWGNHALADVMYYLSSNFFVYKRQEKLKNISPTQTYLHDDKIREKIDNWKLNLNELFFIVGRGDYKNTNYLTFAIWKSSLCFKIESYHIFWDFVVIFISAIRFRS